MDHIFLPTNEPKTDYIILSTYELTMDDISYQRTSHRGMIKTRTIYHLFKLLQNTVLIPDQMTDPSITSLVKNNACTLAKHVLDPVVGRLLYIRQGKYKAKF